MKTQRVAFRAALQGAAPLQHNSLQIDDRFPLRTPSKSMASAQGITPRRICLSQLTSLLLM